MDIPLPESVYFPALDKCLNGEALLISWKTAFIGLSSPNPIVPEDSSLERFLSDPSSTSALSRPFIAFPGPTQQSGVAFNTRTAAINVAPVTSGKYDISQIREDALWLSRESKINEVGALRVVLLEWQTRPAAQLLGGFSEEEVASIQDAAGGSSLGSSLFLPNSSILSVPSDQQKDTAAFNSLENRRLRQLKLYLSERRYILKVSESLIRAGLSDPGALGSSVRGKQKEDTNRVGRIGRTILNARILGGEAGRSGKPFLIECIEAMQERVTALENGSGWFKDEGGRLEAEADWGKNQILEMIHIMQIMFLLLDAQSDITLSSVALAWLRLMSKYAFFDRLEPPYPSLQPFVQPLQSLASLVSLLVLKLPLVLDHLLGETEQPMLVSNGSPESAPYIINPLAISEMQTMLTGAASPCLINASPAVFAWSIILQTMREVVRTRKEARELRQSQRAAHSYSEAESTETEAGESSVTEPGSGGTSPRPHSIGSDISSEPGMYDEVLEDIMKSTLDEDPIGYLAKSAVNGSRVFEVIQNLATEFCVPLSADLNGEDGLRMRNTLLHLVRASLEWVEYLPEVVLAALSLLQGEDRYWEFADAPPVPQALNPAHLFLTNQFLCEKLLNAAIYRFPYEPVPFLRLFKALCSSWSSEPVDDDGALLVIPKLENTPTFTQTLPPNFASYELAHEEDGRNMVQLTKSLNLFGWRDGQQAFLTQATRNQDASVLANGAGGSHIPAGTLGIILFESRPMVAIWYHKYSALKYIGKTLESALADSGVVGYAAGTGLDKDTTGDMVGLITVLLTASTKAAQVRDDVISAPEAAQRILEDASDGVGRNRDVIAIIFDLFEEELQEQQLHPGVDRSMHLLVNCLHFIYALIPVLPGRVWAFLARSGLLQIEGRGGKLAAVVAGTEIISGRYEVLTGCIRIFGALVEDAVTHAIARKGGSRVVARFNNPTAMATGVSENVMKDILLVFARTVVDFFESSPGWKFAVLSERLEIGTNIASIMDKIMCYSYSIDDSPELDSKVTRVLAPAAKFISEVFLSTSPNDNVIRPILRNFYEGIGTPNSTLFLRTLHSWTAQVQATLRFSTTLIHVGRLLRLPTSHLEKQLFKASPLLARLYVAHETYRLPVVALFESLVASAAASEQEPPSLLGHLGPETAKNFLSVLSNLDKPVDDDELDIQIWNLLSAVVSNRQQWLAIYLLTGNTPRGSLTRKGSNSTSGAPRGEPLLAVALDSLVDIESLPPRRALAMLEFVALAEDYWPWAMADMHKHPKFVTAISDFVGKLDTQAPKVENANKIRMASFIAEILAMYLHHLRQLGDDSFVKTLMPKLEYYMRGAVSAPSYNLSLHSNLRKNFEMKFPNTTLLNFKRTQLQRRYFGIDYFYDLDLATKLLRFEPSWTGIRGEGFSYDVVQANINLSVVEAQVFLLHSWKFLATELSSALANDSQLHKAMAKIVIDCLAANVSADLPEAIFARLIYVRADFAFVLMQRLAEVHSTEPEVRAVLNAVWKTMRMSNTNFQLALSSGNATYYRSLLKILFLALRAHMEHGTATPPPAPKQPQPGGSNEPPAHTSSKRSKISVSTAQLILEILELIVTRGFHELAAAVHECPANSSPEDIALVTAILQTSLRIPGIEAIHPQLCQQIAMQGTARVATTLFSWSDRLAIDGDPVYGELSILFLLELSSVPLIAEQLATEGVLAQLANANLMAFVRRGISPFDSPARLHAIWARGLLSLLLNLLEALGPPIAAEVALFLNQFPNQLDAAVANWDNNNTSITAAEPPKPQPPATIATSTSQKKSPTTTHHGISLSMATEAHSLALISHILITFSTNNPSAVGPIPDLKLKRAELAEGLEMFLSHRRILAAKIVPMTPGDVELAGTPGVGGMGSMLEVRVVREMVEARALLLGGDGDGEG